MLSRNISRLEAGMAIASHRNRISKLNKNNLQLLRFFYKLSTVFYLVASLTVSS